MKTSVAKTFFLVGVPISIGFVAFIYLAMEFRHYLLNSPKFAVQSVEVLTEGLAEKAAVLKLTGIQRGANIFSLDLDQVRKNVEKNPWVYSATITRSLPNKIQIRYEQQKPVAILGSDVMYYVNKEGIPFYRVQKGDSLKYPLLQLDGFPKNEESTSRIEVALELLNQMHSMPLFDGSDLGDFTVRVNEEDGGAPYILTMKYPPKILRAKSGQENRLYTVSFGEEDLVRQIKRWDIVVRHLVQQSKTPRLIRLELGKKVVVKLDR